MQQQSQDLRVQISKNIKILLKTEKKTRRQVSDDLGVKYTTFCDWVNGKTAPNYRMLEQLGDYFNVGAVDFYEPDIEEKRQRAKVLLDYASYLSKGKVLDMSLLDSLEEEQIKELLASGFRFARKPLEEYVESTGRPLASSVEFECGGAVGRELW
ncbi:helix-turn-helix domain-containing protein [Pseudobutyrivibrio xylanivorans]|uniref:Helix-turn-helix transcriptional regulator n=1 Tax=Pseudobutyrivibrio xylanivorans TaxID=185007 RepID=A0A5P6VUJ4_PSEXY|nr:helix-turn-helix transcriptional regulator [Pseudobutyrivibrio xylanivorans]QFJ56323.1 helix-turn-helix transcriptional regulator [Pseudobutyrivibrio xylanivorans]